MKPIRILQVLDNLEFGGVQTFLLNYYCHIDLQKIQFDFFVQDGRGVHRQELLQHKSRIFSVTDDYPRKTFPQAFDLFLKSHQEYSIVHVHRNFLNAEILRIARKRHIPIRISHSHSNYPANSPMVRVKRLLFHLGIGLYATHLWGCSGPALDWLYGNWNFFRRDRRVIRNAIPFPLSVQAHADQIKTDYQLEGKFVVIHVGMFTRSKNHNFLLLVFKEIQRQHPQSALLLVGDGKEKNTLQQSVRELKLNNVHFVGSQLDVNAYLSVADCFLFPSFFEGLPFVVIEAQAMGIPCVVSEAIPPEAQLFPSMRRNQLSDSPAVWAQSCLQAREEKSTVSEMMFAATGFAIDTAAQVLQEEYLKINREYHLDG